MLDVGGGSEFVKWLFTRSHKLNDILRPRRQDPKAYEQSRLVGPRASGDWLDTHASRALQ